MINYYRIIDASINRAAEGIRVVEDIARFKYNNKYLSNELRNLRHEIRDTFDSIKIIAFRSSSNDVGKKISFESDISNRANIKDIVLSNFKRSEESLRTLEELSKLELEIGISRLFENIRFKIYKVEKDFLNQIWQLKFEDGIYGITYDNSKLSYVMQVKKMLENGIKVIQYRNKKNEITINKELEICLELKNMCTKYGAILIVNDNVDLAFDIGANGVHLGQEDILIPGNIDKVNQIKKEMHEKNKKFILGVSTHGSVQALHAKKIGADYIGVGPLYQTSTRIHVEKCEGIDYLKWVNNNIEIPYVSIGGIKKNKYKELKSNGCKICAMVTEIDDEKNLYEIVDLFEGRKKIE
ncbi:thiamine phosphate synthase [Helicovermis profundi]|uniref:Thiamine-phosphate synthase n=1 Tax=Helicovermis profundi TaxID=3065157 RepID=A0AAU9E4R2_9FIRM|nr:hypothetical protein HLPR_19350 [Clostridia bacterium S502]